MALKLKIRGGAGTDSGKGDESAGAQSADEKGVDTGTDYQALLAECDTKIAALEVEIAEATKTADAAEKLRTEMDELRRQGKEQRISFELTMADAKTSRRRVPFFPVTTTTSRG